MEAHEPEQGSSLFVSARTSLEASELSPIVNAAGAVSGDQDIELEASGRRHESSLDERPPPLGFKLTGFKLLNMIVIIAFPTSRVILVYMHKSAMPTIVEYIGGGLLVLILFCIGQYESACPKKLEWFLKVDLTRSICYGVLRFIGGVLGVLFAIRGSLAIASLSSVPIFLLAHFLQAPGVSHDLWLWIYVGLTICVLLAWSRVRPRLRNWPSATGFLDEYGLSASLVEEYEWSGTMGITLGFYCGTALVYSPLAIVYFSL